MAGRTEDSLPTDEDEEVIDGELMEAVDAHYPGHFSEEARRAIYNGYVRLSNSAGNTATSMEMLKYYYTRLGTAGLEGPFAVSAALEDLKWAYDRMNVRYFGGFTHFVGFLQNNFGKRFFCLRHCSYRGH